MTSKVLFIGQAKQVACQVSSAILLNDGGAPLQDIITDIQPIQTHAQERLGYPTQKPLALLERIIQASSNEGDV
ncbi:MAG TPA: DNA methyltransferase, partial [Burkholderiales bacterium]|nr:DNA methyltransferase [Burkholderiales bacterium]